MRAIKLRFKIFLFSVKEAWKAARQSFYMNNTGFVKQCHGYIHEHREELNQPFYEEEFMDNWRKDAKRKFELERIAMAKEGLDIEDFRWTEKNLNRKLKEYHDDKTT